MKDEEPRGGWREWAVPAVLLVLLGITVLLGLEARRRSVASPARSALEFLRPSGELDPAYRKSFEEASRVSIAEVARRLLDPANGLGLTPEEAGAARLHVARLGELARRSLWLQCRVVEAVDEASAERFQETLRGPRDRFTNLPAWPSLAPALRGAFPEAAAEARELREAMPEGWGPAQEGELRERWAALLGPGLPDVVSDHFLERRLCLLLTLALASPEVSKERRERLAALGLALADLEEQMDQEWMLLVRVGLASRPERLAQVRMMSQEQDMPFDQFVRALETAGGG